MVNKYFEIVPFSMRRLQGEKLQLEVRERDLCLVFVSGEISPELYVCHTLNASSRCFAARLYSSLRPGDLDKLNFPKISNAIEGSVFEGWFINQEVDKLKCSLLMGEVRPWAKEAEVKPIPQAEMKVYPYLFAASLTGKVQPGDHLFTDPIQALLSMYPEQANVFALQRTDTGIDEVGLRVIGPFNQGVFQVVIFQDGTWALATNPTISWIGGLPFPERDAGPRERRKS